MNWNVVTRIGADDGFVPEISSQVPRIETAFERSGDPWLVGNDVFDKLQKLSGRLPSSTICDLVYLAMSVYASDLRIPRRFASDRWSREITVHFPVSDLSVWTRAQPSLVKTLNFLTGDKWQFMFRERLDSRPQEQESSSSTANAICLFSGGLDSLVGCMDLIAEGKRVALVGHHGAGITNAIQEGVLAALATRYEGQVEPYMFYVQPPKNKLKDGEPTMRSRSFLFLALGVATFSAGEIDSPITIAENGPISLNVPLTPSRVGSCSTRTTHPHFVALYRKLLKELSAPTKLTLPYRFKTKGEMLADVSDQTTLQAVAKLTMSCSHPEAGRFQGFSPSNHCGYCVPCIIRRASMAHAKLPDANYSVDIRTSPPPFMKEAGRDVRAFEMAIERCRKMQQVDWLKCVLATGPLPPEETTQFASVFQRGMEEVRLFMEGKQ